MQDVRHATVGETDTVGSVSGPAEPASEVEGGGHPPPPPSIKDLPPPTKGTVEPPEAPVQGAKMPASPLIPPPPPDPTLGEVSGESHTPAKYPAVDPAGQPHGKKNGSAGQPHTAVQETVTSENPHSNPNPSPNPNPKPNPNPNPGHHRPVAGLQQQPYRVQSSAQAAGPAPGQAHAHASPPVGQQIPLQGPPPPRHGLPMMPPRPGPPMAQLPRHGSPLVHTPHHVPPMGLPSHHRPPMGQPPPPSPVLRAHPFAEPTARPPRFQEPVVRQPSYQVPRPGGSSYRGEAQILYQEEVPPQYHEERLSYVEEGASFQGEGMYGEKGAVYVEEGGSLTEESPTQVPGQARHPRRQPGTLRISKWVNPIPDDPEDGQQQSGEQELATKMLQIQSKRFYIDVKQNRRGRFMKVAEIGADGRRNQVFLALSTAAEFRDHLSHFSDFYANLGPPNPDTLPEDGKLKSETMVKDNRRYYLDLKENSRGRFLRVSQTIARGGPRCQIAIPAQGMIEFRDALQELLDEFGTDDGGYKGELPEGRHMRVENKNFYFDIGQNNRGIYMRISEVKTNFRTAITIPEKSWSRFRDIFADYVDKMKDGGEKGPSESNK